MKTFHKTNTNIIKIHEKTKVTQLINSFILIFYALFKNSLNIFFVCEIDHQMHILKNGILSKSTHVQNPPDF